MSKAPISAAIHSPRLSTRRETFEKVFSVANLESAWKNYVHQGLRQQPVNDLYDYFDFHRNRDQRFEQISLQISAGSYEPRSSQVARLEKRMGLCRPIVIPTPEDALVLQCITENLIAPAILNQPTQNVFFSRSHSTPQTEFTFGKDYIWFKKWREFSKQRYQVSSTHEWVVVTDVANYFDTIIHSFLRNQIAELDGVKEPILDLLFRIIPHVSWKPDYLPLPDRGIPQVQFDAPRLLAHVYMYEIDQFLEGQTGGNFVRWVDDITAAVSNLERGQRLVRDLDALMHTRGIRLNSGKTRILSKDVAFRYFQTAENATVDNFQKKLKIVRKLQLSEKQIIRSARSSFRKFRSKPDFGHKDKVIRRYIGLFSELQDDGALRYCLDSFDRDPNIREVSLSYFAKLGPRLSVIRKLEEYLTGGFALDDVSICQIARFLTRLQIKPNSARHSLVVRLGKEISKETYLRRSPFYLTASLWILGKYGTSQQLASVLRATKDVWLHSEHSARQVAAVCARFRTVKIRNEFFDEITGRGFISAESVIRDQRDLHNLPTQLPSAVNGYILNGRNKTDFGLARILIIHAVLENPKFRPVERARKIDEIKGYLDDPIYLKMLDTLKK